MRTGFARNSPYFSVRRIKRALDQNKNAIRIACGCSRTAHCFRFVWNYLRNLPADSRGLIMNEWYGQCCYSHQSFKNWTNQKQNSELNRLSACGDNCSRTHASRAIRWSHDKHPDLYLYYMWMKNIHESLVYNNNAIIIRNTNGKCIFFFMNSTALHKFRRLDFLYCDMWPLRVANHHSWYMAVIFCTTVRRAWWIERSVVQKHVNCNTLYGTFSFSLDLNIRYIECRMPNDMNSNDFRFFFLSNSRNTLASYPWCATAWERAWKKVSWRCLFYFGFVVIKRQGVSETSIVRQIMPKNVLITRICIWMTHSLSSFYSVGSTHHEISTFILYIEIQIILNKITLNITCGGGEKYSYTVIFNQYCPWYQKRIKQKTTNEYFFGISHYSCPYAIMEHITR